jgi:hypothetical protein
MAKLAVALVHNQNAALPRRNQSLSLRERRLAHRRNIQQCGELL